MGLHANWVAFWTILVKEVRRFTRIWGQTLLPPVITMSLYFVIFGNLIGSRIGEMSGHDYMAFIAPGLIMMSVITNSYSNVVSSFFGNKFQHSIEELLVSPIPNWIVLLGYTLGGVTRGLLIGLIVTLVALCFVDLPIYSFGLVALTIFFTAFLFSLGGFLNALFATTFDDISIVPTFILTPLTYLGGVFYSITLLPEFWQNVSLLNPIFHMVNAFRYGFLGITDINLGFALAMILTTSALLFGLCLHLLNKGTGIRQ
jgi:ABC-2 type transport system permease protein